MSVAFVAIRGLHRGVSSSGGPSVTQRFSVSVHSSLKCEPLLLSDLPYVCDVSLPRMLDDRFLAVG